MPTDLIPTVAPRARAKVKSVECRFATYVKSRYDDSDMHYIKEVWTLEDGTQKSRLLPRKDYERPYWIVPKGDRTYKDLKEWYPKDGLDQRMTTQTRLSSAIKESLKLKHVKGSHKDMDEIKYVFGADILSTALIKHEYNSKVTEPTPYTNAVFDTETDVVKMTGKIIMATLSFKDRVYTVIDQDFFAGYHDPLPMVYAKCHEVLAEYIKARNITLEIVMAPNEMELIRWVFAKAHEWGPDFLSAWNLPFDVNKVLDCCRREGVDPTEIFCDPGVAKEYRSFKFKEGPAKKVTASGRVMSYKPSQRWHTITCPAKFYWVDAMCAYRSIRTGQPEEASYSLDYILSKVLKITKLKHPEGDKFKGIEWHRYMQEHQKFWYVAYNQFDCISMEMLDEATRDLQLALPSQAGYSDFQHFNSQPRRTVNELHFYCLENEQVIACTAMEMEDDFDEETAGAKGWIVMLPSELVIDNGLCIVKENPYLRTNIRVHAGDLDVSAAYPNNGISLNISKKTTRKEMIRFGNKSEIESKMLTLNFMSGRTNAIEFCVDGLGLPNLDTVLEAFEQHLAQQHPQPLALPAPVPLQENLVQPAFLNAPVAQAEIVEVESV